jgi:hypothetical protein
VKLYHGVRQISRVERELLELKRQKPVRITKTLVLSCFYYRNARVAQELPIYTTFTTSTLSHYEISFTISKITPTYVELYVVPTLINTPLNLYDPLPQHNKNIKTIQERTTRKSRALHGRNAYNLKKAMSIERHRTHGELFPEKGGVVTATQDQVISTTLVAYLEGSEHY